MHMMNQTHDMKKLICKWFHLQSLGVIILYNVQYSVIDVGLAVALPIKKFNFQICQKSFIDLDNVPKITYLYIIDGIPVFDLHLNSFFPFLLISSSELLWLSDMWSVPGAA